MANKLPETEEKAAVDLSRLVRRFAHRKHSNPRIITWNPEEREVGWQFEDGNGKTHFVKWGSTKNRETLQCTIADVHRRFGPMEVVDLDTPNKKLNDGVAVRCSVLLGVAGCWKKDSEYEPNKRP